MSRPLAILSLLPLLAAAGLPHARGVCTDSYIVMRGDTLYSIARLCRSSVGAMARANRLASPAAIEVGQRLTVPGRNASVPAFREAAKEEPAPREGRFYSMARGDTLYSLARWAEVSLPALLAANRGIDPRNIEIGAMIRLPAGAALPYPARLRERGPGAAPARYEPPREASIMRDHSPASREPEPDPDKEPEPEGM